MVVRPLGALAQPHRLHIFRALVVAGRDGRHLIERAAFEHIHTLVQYLSANCCHGASCGVETVGIAVDG